MEGIFFKKLVFWVTQGKRYNWHIEDGTYFLCPCTVTSFSLHHHPLLKRKGNKAPTEIEVTFWACISEIIFRWNKKAGGRWTILNWKGTPASHNQKGKANYNLFSSVNFSQSKREAKCESQSQAAWLPLECSQTRPSQTTIKNIKNCGTLWWVSSSWTWLC